MGASKNIIVVAGKSGGHAFPARAVAEALLELEPDLKIHVIHTGSPLEEKIFKDWKTYSLPPLALAGGASLVSRLKTLFFLPFIGIWVFFLMVRLWPQAVFGTGGGLSAPVFFSAFLLARRRSAWEGNAVSGLANRVLAPFLPAVFTVFPNIPSISGKKQMLCGYPLRKDFYQKSLPQKGGSVPRTSPPSFFRVLVLGGSQGSSLLNQVVSEALLEESWPRDIFIFHQTGKKDFISLQEKYRNIKNVEVFAFSKHLRDYYGKCDVVFSRAGSGVLAEVSAVGKSLVLVPLSGTAGDHQVKNAIHLAERNQAEWIPERELTAETFKEKILQLKENNQKRSLLTQNIRKRHKPDGALTIARWLLQEKS